jgi:hypothetical protein
MRTWMERGLLLMVGSAWAGFLAALVMGPADGASRWSGGAAARRPSAEPRLLRRDEVVRLPRAPGRVLRVEAGMVLLTREGDPEDHVLGPEQVLSLAGRGTVAWALAPSRIVLEPVEEAPRPAEVPAR